MSQAEEMSVSEQPIAQETQGLSAAPEAEQVQEAQVPEQKPAKRKKSAEENWAEAQRGIKERDRQIYELRTQLESSKPKMAEAPVEDDELSKMSKDDILTVAQAEKLVLKRAEKIAETVVRRREASMVDERLGTKFTDYADVVSKEAIDILKQQEPELAQSLWNLRDDPYAQGVAAYKMIKRLGIGKEEEEPESMEKKKAIENSKKPVSVQAVTKSSAIGNAHLFENGLTKELKAQLHREMEECRKRA